MKGDTSMEIIIRMEEKENPTVGAALREMASDYWVKTYLPRIIEAAKGGATRHEEKVLRELSENTQSLIKESFSKLGIQVSCWGLITYKSQPYHTALAFSWA
jgi:hypothetical protein